MITRNQIIHYTSDELIRVSIALTTGIVEKARQRIICRLWPVRPWVGR